MALTIAQQNELRQQRAAEDAQRLKKLYGPYLDDVRVLEKKGFVITREGRSFMVGNKTVDGETLRAMADRERRLDKNVTVSGVRKPAQTASGLKIGESVPLRPKVEIAHHDFRSGKLPKTPPATAVITAPPVRAARPTGVNLCGCGKPSSHQGMCSVRWAKRRENHGPSGERPRVVAQARPDLEARVAKLERRLAALTRGLSKLHTELATD